MTADRVLGLLDLLTGVDVWVDGGWGVDALVGEQTREHGDLDLGVARTELATVLEVLASAGYVVSDDRFADVTVQLTHTEGHRVDLHPSTPLPGGGTEQIDFDGETFYLPPPSAGRIGGREVRCMPLSSQLRTHSGYELRDKDHHDVELLHGLERAAD
ncbi:nucleotidyltransferase domain-containing protein [Kribbella sp. DT2]|uniref:nucleotidyltransferase domain-containing protein n=1 Tax=Kribbella sp. DT2 TaxID=3393427 RepID=UPI003CEF0B0D